MQDACGERHINVRKYVYCTLHENHFAGCCNLSPNKRIIAAVCARVLSKLFPCVNERGRKYIARL